MAGSPGRTPTGGRSAGSRRVSGAVLITIRAHHLGLTREQFAERCGSPVGTVERWENGTRALGKSSYEQLDRLRHTLRRAGATPAILAVWENALRADGILDNLDAAPADHPFALDVPDRSLTELLAWQMTGTPPRELNGHAAPLHTPSGIRDDIATQLREAVDRSANQPEVGPMITRQALFLLAGHEPSRDWVEHTSRRGLAASRDLTAWSPLWPMARTTAVAASVAGDHEPLQRFVTEGLSTPQGIDANLAYWAYWVGETSIPWARDADMLTANDWSGRKLLATLCNGLDNAVPYRELCAHTLWALLNKHPELETDPKLAQRIVEVIDRVTGQAGLVSAHASQLLGQVGFAVKRNM